MGVSNRIYITADTHFGHSDAIEKFTRPFSNVDEMDDALVANINEVVGADDLLYHLGDFIGPVDAPRTKTAHARTMRERIACKRIVLIRGNHDPHGKDRFDDLFESVHDLVSFQGWGTAQKQGDQRVVMAHYAMRVWQGRHNGALHVYGHTHGTISEVGRSTDVGVDCWSYRPQLLEDVLAMLASREIDMEHVRPRVQEVRGR